MANNHNLPNHNYPSDKTPLSLTGTEGNDILIDGPENDSLDGGAGNDHLASFRGADHLMGGEGDDVLESRSDAGEPAPAQGIAARGTLQGDEDSAGRAHGYDLPTQTDDTLTGGSGADLFLFRGDIDARLSIAAQHTNRAGVINWGGVAGENDNTHDHWVESFGNDLITDFNAAEGDRIHIAAHTVAATFTQIDADGDGAADDTLITLTSNQGGTAQDPNGAHDQDALGTITVLNSDAATVEANTSTHAHALYGTANTLAELTAANAVAQGVAVNVRGRSASDRIIGGATDDQISGGQGNDTLRGGGGNDKIDGGRGYDHIDGGAGDDTLKGGSGRDQIDGGDGDDQINGGSDHDVLTGGAGNDAIIGGSGYDKLSGDAGNDTLNGGGGRDQIDGGEGDDQINGGSDHDVLTGGDGNDVINGGSGYDMLSGDTGDDVLNGGGGRDQIDGGDGDDQINGGSDHDVLTGGDGNDVINGSSGYDKLSGDAGNDTLNGGSGRDQIDGGDGDDQINGGSDHDVLTGGAGNDAIIGGNGYDKLDGGAGDDVLSGGRGRDKLVDGAGNDLLNGGSDHDVLTSFLGADTLMGGNGNDRLESRSDAGEPVPAQTGDSADRVNQDFNPTDVDDVLTGGRGADTFYFRLDINAGEEIAARHAGEDGRINWHAVAGENDNVHDHWVEGIGNDLITDYKAGQDKIVIEGHTVAVEFEFVDGDNDGNVDDTLILLYSDQGGSVANPNGAHDQDQLGTITVLNAQLDAGDITVDAGVHYGAFDTLSDLQDGWL